MKLIRSQRKTIALIVEADGSLTIRAPLHTSQAVIEQALKEKADWIKSRQQQARQSMPAPVRYDEGELFLYLGRAYPLRLVERRQPPLALVNERFELERSAQTQAAAHFEGWYRRQAQAYLATRVQALSQQHGLPYSHVGISGAKTRWGSCSSHNRLNFTWRLMMAPPEVIDYIILHELAHIRVKNHSPAFWALVAQMQPNYRQQRDWLTRNGKRLIQQ
jgi:predicted metal-dependent hydrolase